MAKRNQAAEAETLVAGEIEQLETKELTREEELYELAAQGDGSYTLVPASKVEKNQTVEVVTVDGKQIERDGMVVVKVGKKK